MTLQYSNNAINYNSKIPEALIDICNRAFCLLELLFVLSPSLGLPLPLSCTVVIQSDCSLVYLSADWFLIVLHALRLCLWETQSAGPSGKHHVSQLCSTGSWDSLRCCCCCSAPLLTGEVGEIKCKTLNLIPPNGLWHPHFAGTAADDTKEQQQSKQSVKDARSKKTHVHHFPWQMRENSLCVLK